MATVTIDGKIWTENDLPNCVTLNKDKFLERNTPAHPSDLMDRTQRQAVYLYIDLYGLNDRRVRTVFDSGATISLWLNEVVTDGLLEARIDPATPAAVSGIGNGSAPAITCDVVLPGNIINKTTGNYIDYW